jgi:RNA polymerase sigma factor (sigma-70 family)
MANAPWGVVLRHVRQIVAAEDQPQATDAELLQAFIARRDEAAFTALVRRHGPMVLGVCRHLLHHQQDAEDAFQATFLILARQVATLRNRQALTGWLHGVAYRTCQSLKRAAARRRKHEGQVRTIPPQTPVAELAWREVQAALEQEIARLPEKYRTVFVLCCQEGRSRAEAAHQLGLKEGTVCSRLDHARKRLQQRLSRQGISLAAVLSAVALARDAGAAAVPAFLRQTTVQAALAYANGQTAAGAASAGVAALVEGVTRTMLATKLKMLTACVLVAGVIATGAGLLAHQTLTTRPPERPQDGQTNVSAHIDRPGLKETAQPRTDRYGDPLPDEAIARLGTARLRHPYVRLLRFSPDGKTLVAHGWEGGRTWDVATGKEIRFFSVGSDWQQASLSQDGKLLATSDQSGVLLREVESGKEVCRFGSGPYSQIRLSPDGRILAGQHVNPRRLELWDVANGRQLHAWQGDDQPFSFLDFLNDGKTLISGRSPYITTPVHPDNKFHLWEVATGKERRQFSVGAGNLRDVTLSPDGSLLAFGFFDTMPTNRIAIWDVAGGKKVREIVGTAKKPLWAGQLYFAAFAFTPDGKTLVAGGIDETLIAYDLMTGAEVRRFGQEIVNPQALTISPEGKTLAVGLPGSAIRLLDLATGKDHLPGNEHLLSVHQMAVTPDARTVVTASGGSLLFWDAATGQLRCRPQAHLDWVQALRMSGDGQSLVTSAADRSYRNSALQVWDVTSGKERRRFPVNEMGGAQPLAVTPDGQTAALAAAGGTVVAIDLTTGQERQRLKGQAEFLSGAAFAPDSRTLTVWGNDDIIHRWDVTTGREVGTFSVLAAIRQAAPGDPGVPLPAKPGRAPVLVDAASVSSDGRFIAVVTQRTAGSVAAGAIAVATNQAGVVTIHELATGRLLRTLADLPSYTRTVALSPDGRTLAWGDYRRPLIHLVEVATGRERHQFTGHRGGISCLAFSADGRTLVSGGEDTTAIVWDLTGRLGAKGTWGKPLSPAELDACWADLDGADAACAYQTIRRLAGIPDQAASYLGKQLRPVPAPDAKHVAGLIADLDSPQFRVRENAMKELEKLGEVAADACRKALTGQQSPEVRRRLETLLDKQAEAERNPPSERLRMVRALEVLEGCGTPEARHLLTKLAAGESAASLTQRAKEALQRGHATTTARP